MKVQFKSRFVTDWTGSDHKYAVGVEMKFKTLNNCCGMGAMTDYSLSYLVRGRSTYSGKVMWIPMFCGEANSDKFDSVLPEIRDWFAGCLYHVVSKEWPVAVIQVVDYSKEICSPLDAVYEKKWSVFDFLSKIKRKPDEYQLQIDWSKAYENNSGNYVKMAFVTELEAMRSL